jgi:hypothetical protein
MAAINSREAKPKRNAWQKGASMYVEKLLSEICAENQKALETP